MEEERIKKGKTTTFLITSLLSPDFQLVRIHAGFLAPLESKTSNWHNKINLLRENER